MNVKVTDFLEVFSGLIPCTLGISAEFLRKFWEGFEISLGFIISEFFSASTQSALGDTDGSIMGQWSGTLKI